MRSDFASSHGMSSKRSFVFLQGPTSSAFRDLGRTLADRGHDVIKINFCPGDWVFWRGSDTVTFRGTLDEWPTFLKILLKERNATDIVYFADRFPYHRQAQVVARAMGVRPVSLEYGYLRPDWLILEEGGQSTYSHFTTDAEQIRNSAAELPPILVHAQHNVPAVTEAICETTFHLSNAFWSWIFAPNYAPDRYYPVIREFSSYVPRMFRRAMNASVADATIKRLQNIDGKIYLVPLQMQNDYQLRDNAPAEYQAGFIRDVMTSFESSAPDGSQLVFKLHPMDNGIERWERQVPEIASEFGLLGRIHFIDGGDLSTLFDLVSGCIVINSTMGLRALQNGVPTKALGVAIYDITQLTFRGPLDEFWNNCDPPDSGLLNMFVRALADGIHIRGAVYGKSGRAAFIENAMQRLEAPKLHRDGLYVSPPPRVAHAKALGIEVDPMPALSTSS